MALMTGNQYRRHLQENPNNFWYGSEQVKDATTHPATKRTVDTYAGLYDLAADPANEDALTIPALDTAGHAGCERDHFSFILPEGKEDLVKYRNGVRTYSRATAGLYGRGQDMAATFLTGVMAMSDVFAPNNPEWSENARRYYEKVRRECRFVSHATVHPQWDRTRPIGESPTLRVVEELDAGLRVSGVRTVCTAAPFTHDTVIATLPANDLQPEQALLFATPSNQEGISVVARESLSSTRAEVDPRSHPLGAFGDELDALVIYDNVLVPWENVFHYGDPTTAFRFGPLSDWVSYQVLIRLQTKAEVLTGLAQMITEAIGTSEIQGVKDFVIECMRYAETLQAFLVAAEDGWRDGGNGIAVPDGKFITLGRMYGVEHYRRILGILQDLSGQSLLLQPPPSTYDVDEFHETLERVFGGANSKRRDRNRLFRAVWDFACDGLGGRQDLFELFNGTNTVQMMHAFLMPRYDMTPMVETARSAIGLDLDDDATVARRIAETAIAH